MPPIVGRPSHFSEFDQDTFRGLPPGDLHVMLTIKLNIDHIQALMGPLGHQKRLDVCLRAKMKIFCCGKREERNDTMMETTGRGVAGKGLYSVLA